jgi:hypothetical protein
MSGAWGCPHELHGQCQRVKGRPCDPGMKGCILFGRFVFSNPAKNRPPKTQQQRQRSPEPPDKT